MNILFEEEGSFKAGSVLADNTTSLQVELPTGKRSKVKAANVLLRFVAPSAAELLTQAESEAGSIDTDFLWEACPEGEFGFEDMATDYYGQKPTAVEAATLLLALHAAPMYFHRKGKGRFRKAPPEILQAAKAGLEKKRLQAEAQERMAGELKAGRLPAEFPPLLREMLYKPDRNRIETKALEAACAETGLSVPRLLEKCGAITDTHEYHLGRFLFEFFPKGTGFPAPWDNNEAPPPILPRQAGEVTDHPPSPGRGDGGEGPPFDDGEWRGLPLAEVHAFSIDDAHTTEIDDAFSVVFQPDGGMRVGIHIAAPGLGISPESDLGKIARERLSTVYMPGRKITMLPEPVVERFTLSAGSHAPALSLYLEVAPDLRVLGHESRIERVPVVANLRHHDIEPLFNEQTLQSGLGEFAFRDELKRLWELATVLEAGRGKAGKQNNRKDYNFHVDWERTSPQGPGWIEIEERPRGSPLDTLVAELMIVANSTWGGLLAQAKVGALYRGQTSGKVRMTTVPTPHEGLGVDCYAWTTSPLRRYTDLLNQWQLIALLGQETPPFPAKSAELLAAMRDFDITYAAYADFQRGMERYWCLRWLLQQERDNLSAQVIRENLVRCDELPLVLRVPSLPACNPGQKVALALEGIDLLDAELRPRFTELLDSATVDGALGEEEGGE
ncbi:ribonuclease catalytic domain-containing protein [Denitratisoma oestradiolicum]|uniref:Ribonuclease II n=1 Tax=Denitratisoma oestradiolicum TaxID=311182 RepID=A0A6S6XRV3_9PROT|nr:RNB domain-containing ribonuclease [Denitratisoma oestradiolicum]TWO79698.1 ribonuclease II [Denitratisoma oestradiolicum]CAB1367455.1 Ribonuclease II [Denitratisoma oestradiolicum]